jgi:hypothetical protein
VPGAGGVSGLRRLLMQRTTKKSAAETITNETMEFRKLPQAMTVAPAGQSY